MKKIVLALLCAPVWMIAQTNTQNWTKKTTYRDANGGRPVSTVTYYDGLGRPIQQNASKQSGTGKDMITHIEYELGRQLKEYLPYPATTNDMSFQTGAQASTLSYSQYSGQSPFSEKILELSPLARPLKQGAPGTDWQVNPNADTDHTIKMAYLTNSANEVKNYFALTTKDNTNGVYSIQLQDKGFYSANRLFKTVIKDENWKSGTNNTTEEFKDNEGRVILKRTYNNGAYDTYYVYDLYGNLTYVIPPLATNPASQLDNLCYQYKYDSRNRMVEKKLPGKQWEFIVYDKMDRVVATGPALSPFGGTETGYLITKYDELSRVAYTGWLQTASTRSALQQQYNTTARLSEERVKVGTTQNVDNVGIGYTNLVIPMTGMKLLTVTYYDNYQYPNSLVSTQQTDPLGQEAATATTGQVTGSWVRVLTTPSETLNEQSYTLYDSKYRPIRSYTTNHLGGYTRVDSKLDFSGKTEFTLTYHKLNSSSPEYTVKDTYTYTDEDRMLTHVQQINGGAEELITKNTYDELGRLESKIVGGPDTTGTSGMQKVDYRYNIRGWMTDINNEAPLNNPELLLGDGDLFGFKINYNQVTKGEAGKVVLASESMGGDVVPLYNGNISETFWITQSDNILRKYGYQYDALNRLNKAFYQKPISDNPTPGSYNETVAYDKNGNITSMKRTGNLDHPTVKIDIDDLTYFYNGNRLMRVNDLTNNPEGFKDNGYGNTYNDYAYDANGNMTQDANKKITNIVYNHLNLPTEILFADSNKITYIYNAAGVKVQKSVLDGGSTSRVDYLQGFQYENQELSFFPHAEGYVKVTEGNYFNYVYNYTDHLGNIRTSWTWHKKSGNVAVMEENHYYPFGLKHRAYNIESYTYAMPMDGSPGYNVPELVEETVENPNPYKYKYQGQERQDELGLNWDSFKYRNYDYTIGRFMSIDPLAEKYIYQSPYNFAENKVIDHYELEGLEGIQMHTYDKNGNLSGIKYKLDNYVVTGTKGEYHSNFTSSDVKNVQAALDSNFSGTFTDPDSGVPVTFELTAKPLFMQKVETNANGNKELINPTMNTGDVARAAFSKGTKVDDGTTSLPAFVVGQSNIGNTDGGESSVGIKVDKNSPEGFSNALGHEVLHFMLDRNTGDDHSLKGGLGRPMTSPFINDAILKSLKKNVPRASQFDKKDN